MDGWTPVYHGDKAAPLPVEVTAHLLDKEGLADALAADEQAKRALSALEDGSHRGFQLVSRAKLSSR